jgi:prepilin-type N-terminal cleavage/methylation domain-containing protein/prepilin-type processing-associated H-X9-DG protein
MSKLKARSGFTLIELLVVIAIIAILAAILFPVFSKAREKARQAACQSNLKQISMAMRMYTQDYDEKYPFHNWSNGLSYPYNMSGVNDWTTDAAKPNWPKAMLPYMKNEEALLCPSSKVILGDHPVSYFGNGLIFQIPLSEAKITAPADTVLFHCFGKGESYVYTFPFAKTTPNFNDLSTFWMDVNADMGFYMHNQGSNFCFADGHVKYLKFAYVDKNEDKLFDPIYPRSSTP